MKRLLPLLLAALALASCAKNPFATRDSEEPTVKAGTFIPPTTPQIVLENLRLSYSELVISNFIQCLDSAFAFGFDFIQGAQGDSSWRYASEIRLTEKLFNDFNTAKTSRSIKIVFATQAGQTDVVLDSVATLVRSYVLTVIDSANTTLKTYQGVAQFALAEGAFNFWTLVGWKDLHLNLATRSWADFKNEYR